MDGKIYGLTFDGMMNIQQRLDLYCTRYESSMWWAVEYGGWTTRFHAVNPSATSSVEIRTLGIACSCDSPLLLMSKSNP